LLVIALFTSTTLWIQTRSVSTLSIDLSIYYQMQPPLFI
jgi:hypothetical protein